MTDTDNDTTAAGDDPSVDDALKNGIDKESPDEPGDDERRVDGSDDSGDHPDGDADGDDDGDALDSGLSEEEYQKTVSQLLRVGLSDDFKHNVEETIRQRSGGRFFGRKAFGQRVRYEILALLILAIGLIAFLVIRSSTTGSLRYEQKQETPKMAPGAKDVVPQPKQLERE